MGSGSSKPSSSALGGSSSYIKPSGIPIAETFNVAEYSPGPTNKKKTALLIGINYRNTVNQLNGCINDVTSVKALLDTWEFQSTVMTDDTPGSLYPNKNNILAKLEAMVQALVTGDVLVIYYSGHGTRIPDISGDESTGLDSVICPVDVVTQGYISDDNLRNILNKAAENSKILAFFDSCNSGSVCDLRYNYFDTSYRSNPGDKASNLIVRPNLVENTNYSPTTPKIITLSGCRDDQLSVEALYVNGQVGGALTYFVLKYLYENTPAITFQAFLTAVRQGLVSKGFSQNPSLMSGNDNFNPTSDTIAEFLNIQ
jgi:hypothetical protein